METAMDTEEKKQALQEEIDEIEGLIRKWQPAEDDETRWAIDLLQLCLIRRKQLLINLSIPNGN